MIVFVNPMFLWAIPASIVVLLILLAMDFVKLPRDREAKKQMRKYRFILFITRSIIVSALIIAAAQPIQELEVTKQTSVKLNILVDNSSSMQLLPFDIDEVLNSIGDDLPVKVMTIGQGERSNLGEGVLFNLEQDMNYLLITDGHSNDGISLAEAALEASNVNASLSALRLDSPFREASVEILGPAKAVEDVETTFALRIQRTQRSTVNIRLVIDDELILEESTQEDTIVFTRGFAPGQHLMRVEIVEPDRIAQNNVYHKVVDVVPKPRIAFLSLRPNPLDVILDDLYTVDKVTQIPPDLDPYYAIIIDDIPAERVEGAAPLLTQYLTEGNGLFVLGGFNSFDRGSYKNSLFESLLPVRVGAGEKKKGDANIVMVIDISLASDLVISGRRVSPLDITKAMAIELINTLNLANKVGVVAFSADAYKVSDISPLYEHKAQTVDKVSRLKGVGQSSFDVGLQGAFEMLKSAKGDRNIILLTDGLAFKGVQDRTANTVDALSRVGVKTYVVGVGRSVQHDFLNELAARGNGIYLPASDANRLSVLFGDPEEIEQGQEFFLFVLNPYHFITRGIEPTAFMNGYNQVIAKDAARSLITTQGGEPALTVWNYGVGRVGALTVFSGGDLGNLLNEENSILLSRSINWLIGDPERKADVQIFIDDTTVDTPSRVLVRSRTVPTSDELDFHKIDEDLYESSTFQVGESGFSTIFGRSFAVNEPVEYVDIGFDEDLDVLMQSTGGKVFKPEELPSLVEHLSKIPRRLELQRVSIAWAFIAIAMLVFLLEIAIRRMHENNLTRKG